MLIVKSLVSSIRSKRWTRVESSVVLNIISSSNNKLTNAKEIPHMQLPLARRKVDVWVRTKEICHDHR